MPCMHLGAFDLKCYSQSGIASSSVGNIEATSIHRLFGIYEEKYVYRVAFPEICNYLILIHHITYASSYLFTHYHYLHMR